MTIFAAVLYPNAEGVVAAILRDSTGLQVENRVPNPRPADPFYVVHRLGGTTATVVSDAAQVAVEAWAVEDADAYDACAEARARLHATPGTTVNGVPIYRVDEVGGPANLPDPLSDHQRWTFTVAIHLRGTAL